MTGSKTDYLEDALINHVLRNTSYTSPTTVYFAVFTSDPTDSGTQTGEPSGSNYARVAITFAAPSPAGETQNSVAIEFGIATGSWGTLTHFGIMDALTVGNMLYHAALDASKAITTDDKLEVLVGGLQVDET